MVMTSKSKVILALLCTVSGSFAQSGSSMGIVGITHVQQNQGFYIAGMQYNSGQTNTPLTIYGDTLPLGSKVYKWNGTGYQPSEYTLVFDFDLLQDVEKWDADFSLDSGEGYWVEVPSATSSYLNGNVPVDDAITNSIAAGFQICSYPYPVDCAITNLGFTPSLGDKIYVWNGTGYQSSEYTLVFDFDLLQDVEKWDNETMVVKVGQGFWYESTVATNWIVQRPYSL